MMIEPCAHEVAGFGGLLSFRIDACADYYEQVREAYVVARSYGTPVGGAYSLEEGGEMLHIAYEKFRVLH